MSKKNNQNENEALESFAQTALRRNKTGSYEQLLCQHLIKAVAEQPTEKIRLICEAAYMVPGFESENLEVIFEVSTSFNATQYNVFKDSFMRDPSMRWPGVIAWGFKQDEESYTKYIQPWIRTLGGLIPNTNKSEKSVDEMTNPEYFFWVTRHAHNSTLEILKSRFTIWAVPKAMQILEQLTAYVSPDTYAEMLEKVKQ